MMPTAGPVFLHSSFRVSSTWFWSCFQSREGIAAFYEIFNESLASITHERAESDGSAEWRSKHPPGLMYFQEYLPLIRSSGGVEGYHPRMGLQGYVPRDGIDGTLTAEECRYVGGLLAHARDEGKRPVLSANRSLGRVRALKRQFSGVHILVYRNLFEQWCSFTDQIAHGNTSFFDYFDMIVQNGGHDERIATLRESFDLDKGMRPDRVDHFCAFALLHLYLYANALECVDIVVDTSLLAVSPSAQRAAEFDIRRRTGIELDLSGAERSLGFCLVDLGSGDELGKLLGDHARAMFAFASSPAARVFVEKAIVELAREYERYRFYTDSLSAFLTRGNDGAFRAEETPSLSSRFRRSSQYLLANACRLFAPDPRFE